MPERPELLLERVVSILRLSPELDDRSNAILVAE
jgi:hypothetical protein